MLNVSIILRLIQSKGKRYPSAYPLEPKIRVHHDLVLGPGSNLASNESKRCLSHDSCS